MFPIDDETLRYLRLTGRPAEPIAWSSATPRSRACSAPTRRPTRASTRCSSSTSRTVEPSLAGPRRPQDRVALGRRGRRVPRRDFPTALDRPTAPARTTSPVDGRPVGSGDELPTLGRHGSVVIAAITSCTNTSNPSVMVGAGLLAKKAVERGPDDASRGSRPASPPARAWSPTTWTSAGLTPYLEALRFHLVGYGCTTCIGNSGPLAEPIAAGDRRERPGRRGGAPRQPQLRGPHPPAGARQLPGLAAAGRGLRAGRHGGHRPRPPSRSASDRDGDAVYLRDIWPTPAGGREACSRERDHAGALPRAYATSSTATSAGAALPVPDGDLYDWDADSTYVQEPPFFAGPDPGAAAAAATSRARALARAGRLDHHRPHLAGRRPSRRQPGRASTCIEHGVRARATSTATAPGAATTR